MTPITARHTADERREEIIAAAFSAFADNGLDGTSTETIAQRVGISQPYLFRLFHTKKELFLAAVERCFDETLELFRVAVEEGDDTVAVHERMGMAYVDMIRNRTKLRMQMQAYAACDDPDVRRVVQKGFSELAAYIQRTTLSTPSELAHFLAKGMLLNVLASMDLLDSHELWATTIRDGCMEEEPA